MCHLFQVQVCDESSEKCLNHLKDDIIILKMPDNGFIEPEEKQRVDDPSGGHLHHLSKGRS